MILFNELFSLLLLSDRDYRFDQLWLNAIVVAFVLYARLVKKETTRFAFLAVFQLAIFLVASPWVGNHVLPQAFISFLGLIYILANIRKSQSLSLEKDFLPQLLPLFLTFYFITTFHKLNLGFFDIQESCASYVSNRMLQKLGQIGRAHV